MLYIDVPPLKIMRSGIEPGPSHTSGGCLYHLANGAGLDLMYKIIMFYIHVYQYYSIPLH